MSCEKIYKYLSQVTEGALTPGLLGSLQDHVVHCPSCWQALDTAKHTVASLKRAPVLEVPQNLWERIAAQTVEAPMPASVPALPWWQRLSDFLGEFSWGGKMAFSSAAAATLVLLVVVGSWNVRHGPALPVIELSANPGSAFPAYFREHHNPALQPVSDGAMVLAFNTLSDKPK